MQNKMWCDQNKPKILEKKNHGNDKKHEAQLSKLE